MTAVFQSRPFVSASEVNTYAFHYGS
jgi:hypothetical protein